MRATAILIAAILAIGSVPVALGGADEDTPPGLERDYIVGFHEMPRIEPGDELHGAIVTGVSEALSFVTVTTAADAVFTALARADERVRYVELDGTVATLLTPNDPRFGDQWGFHGVPGIEAEPAWDVTLGSTSVVVAVLDTGLEKSHEDIGNFLQGRDFVNGDDDPADGNGHGTHVSGTVGALTDNGIGVAGTAQTTILPVKVLSDGGSGSFSDVAAGIVYAADQGADIISMSLGCDPPCSNTATSDALQYASDNGVLSVCAAGNAGPRKDSVGFPASDPNCMAISASTSSGGIARFSSRGAEVELIAPGSGILSTWIGNDYRSISGTSMACPHVSGVGALAIAGDSSLGGQSLRSHLRSTAVDLGLAPEEQGDGAVNALQAVGGSSGGGGGDDGGDDDGGGGGCHPVFGC